MERRDLLIGACATLAATLAGCSDNPSSGSSGDSAGNRYPDCLAMADTDSDDRFLEDGETPKNSGVEAFLTTVRNETDGLYRFSGDDDTDRIGFSESGDTWELRYSGQVVGGMDKFKEEITTLATAFVSNRSDGVSLYAEAYHECTTGTWYVCPEPANEYDSGEIGRETYLDRVHETAEIVNEC